VQNAVLYTKNTRAVTERMVWKFESGIVGIRTNVFGAFCQRVYHVRYTSDTHLRRIITASFTYSKIVAEKKEEIIESLVNGDIQEFNKAVENTGTLVPSMSNIVAIMDFDINEEDRQPSGVGEIDGTFHKMHNSPQQSQDDFTSLVHFEANLGKAKYNKCVCTLTNDEESKRRIDEILTPDVKTDDCERHSSSFSRECCEHPELINALKRVFELEAIVIQQRNTIEELKSKIF
jgi:hypothetical protein